MYIPIGGNDLRAYSYIDCEDNRFPSDDPEGYSISCDGMHLNCYGYELMADIWYDTLN